MQKCERMCEISQGGVTTSKMRMPSRNTPEVLILWESEIMIDLSKQSADQ